MLSGRRADAKSQRQHSAERALSDQMISACRECLLHPITLSATGVAWKVNNNAPILAPVRSPPAGMCEWDCVSNIHQRRRSIE
jgi:hypothetical protein